MDLQPGDVFAGHRIDGVAGRGGMGVVYRATQLSLERTVALKTIAPELAADQSFRARFVRESKAAATIEHPNVLPLFSAGEDDGVLFLAMRYVDGPDLRSLLREEGALAPERAGAIVAQIAAALDVAHECGLIHRDVKPANILLDHAEHAYLADFGLTKRIHSSVTVATRPGGWVGTLGYVAPEQIRDEPVDGRADIYALGCVLFHAIAGAPPYERSSDEATLFAHLQDEPPRLPDGAPEELGDVLARALAKRPEDRFATAGAFGRAVLAAIGRPASAVAGLDRVRTPAPPVQETPVTPPTEHPDAETQVTRRATRTQPRRTIAAVAIAAALVGGAVATALVTTDGSREPSGRAPTATTSAGGDSIRIGALPNGVAAAGGRAYVALPRSDRLVSVKLDDFSERNPSYPVGRAAADLDAGFGALWATSASSQKALVRISLETGAVTRQPLPEGLPVAVAAGERGVWVGIRGASVVARADPRTGAVTKLLPVPGGIEDLAVGHGAVWVTNRRRDTVTRIDARTGAQSILQVGRGPSGIAVGGGAVWVANSGEGTVSRISVRDVRRVRTTGVLGRPRGLAYGGGRLWIAGFTSDQVTSLDGATGDLVGQVPVSANPTKLVATDDALLVLARGADRLERIPFAG